MYIEGVTGRIRKNTSFIFQIPSCSVSNSLISRIASKMLSACSSNHLQQNHDFHFEASGPSCYCSNPTNIADESFSNKILQSNWCEGHRTTSFSARVIVAYKFPRIFNPQFCRPFMNRTSFS